MKNKKYLIVALALLLCLAMVLPMIPFDAEAEPANFHPDVICNDDGVYKASFKGKRLSILGDSISTFEGVSNDGTANSTIANNAVYYYENTVSKYGVARKDTWWQQAIDTLDFELCVNNSWSGSQAMGTTSGDSYRAWQNRCKNLHKTAKVGDSTTTLNPDIIAVYLGTNDVKNATTTFATFADNKNTMLTQAGYTDANIVANDVKYFSRYIKMVNNMMTAYPNAQIYLFTLLPNESQNDVQRQYMEGFNQSIRDLVTYYQGQSKKVYLVDLYNETSITRDFEILNKHLANTLHPNAEGMDVITNCFLSSVVQNSGWALNPANYKTVEYDLTDVYVRGGQINIKRVSGSDEAPLSVTLVPTRAEYGMEVKVEKHHKNNDTWSDITQSCYSDGAIFLRNVSHSYDRIRITAKATYTPKNFRWETKDSSFVAVTPDGKDYGISGTLTQNSLTMTNGSYNGTAFTDGQYKLSDTVLLRNEEPWVVEWKASGTMKNSFFLFSGSQEAAPRNNVYIWTTSTHVNIGYRNDYKSAYWNYNAKLPDGFVMNASTFHVYRLVNRLNADGTNMVYLYIDGTEIGALNNYYIDTTAQTGTLKTQNWLSGRDLEFSYMGALNFYLNDCGIEYLQVWEGGGFDTLRLQQLIDEYNNELKTTMSGASNFTAYKNAVTAAQTYLNAGNIHDQATIDTHVNTITTARNNLTRSASATQIYSVELINGGYVPANMPAGLKIITTPDVQKIQIGNTAQTLLTNTSSIQTMQIGGVDTQVKVWLVSFKRNKTSEVTYRIHAAKSSSAVISSEDDSDASVLFKVPHVAKWITSIAVTKNPTRTEYAEGDTFDPTGMELTAYYADGTSEVVTGYTYSERLLYSHETSITINYQDKTYSQNTVSVNLPITVYTRVSALAGLTAGDEVTVLGYFAGVADEGSGSDKELLLKDKHNDAIIAVRNFSGGFPDYGGVAVGDELKIKGQYALDGSANTPNKMYLDCYSRQRLSQGNAVTYQLNNVVEVGSWAEMEELFRLGELQEYTYIKFTGDFLLHRYDGTDGVANYRLHMNPSATKAADIKLDSKVVGLRDTAMVKNLGADWLSLLGIASTTDTYPGTEVSARVTALYTGASDNYFQMTILDPSWITKSVSNLNTVPADTTVNVEGYFVGVADEGSGSDKELLLKDTRNDTIIAVRNFPGSFPDYSGLVVGDKLQVTATYKLDGSANTPNKMYLNYVSHTKLSDGNGTVYFSLKNAVKVGSWAEMEELYRLGELQEYTYVEFTGDFYLHRYDGTDGVANYRLHMNADAKKAADIKLDGKVVGLRDTAMTKNLGADWLTRLGITSATDSYPGTAVSGRLFAVFTGASDNYFQMTILDPTWILKDVSDLSTVPEETTITVDGYYVGVAQEGPSDDQEILLKDKKTDALIAVRNFPGTFPDYDLAYGDQLYLTATYKKDGTTYTPNKMYLDYVSHVKRSTGNVVTYALTDVVQINSWADAEAMFQADTIQDYTYVEFTGDFYLHMYDGTVDCFRIHMNPSATKAAEIMANGRVIGMRDNVMVKNLGADWMSRFGLSGVTTDYPGTAVSGRLIAVYTGGYSVYNQLTVLDASWIIKDVSDLNTVPANTTVTVDGYFVGIAEEGVDSDQEILLKDKNTDAIIAVRNCPGVFPYNQLYYGDELRVTGTYKLDGTTNTPNKMYLDCRSFEKRSAGNTVTYDLTNTVKVGSWAEMQALFQVGTIQDYTYIEFTGDFYLNEYEGKDKIHNYRLHMNANATSNTDIRVDGSRYVCMRNNIMLRNLGTRWLERFGITTASTGYPGSAAGNKLIALYTGANSTYYQLTILDPTWIG